MWIWEAKTSSGIKGARGCGCDIMFNGAVMRGSVGQEIGMGDGESWQLGQWEKTMIMTKSVGHEVG